MPDQTEFTLPADFSGARFALINDQRFRRALGRSVLRGEHFSPALPRRLIRLARAVAVEPEPDLLAVALLTGFIGRRRPAWILRTAAMISHQAIRQRGTIYRGEKTLLVFDEPDPPPAPAPHFDQVRQWHGPLPPAAPAPPSSGAGPAASFQRPREGWLARQGGFPPR